MWRVITLQVTSAISVDMRIVTHRSDDNVRENDETVIASVAARDEPSAHAIRNAAIALLHDVIHTSHENGKWLIECDDDASNGITRAMTCATNEIDHALRTVTDWSESGRALWVAATVLIEARLRAPSEFKQAWLPESSGALGHLPGWEQTERTPSELSLLLVPPRALDERMILSYPLEAAEIALRRSSREDTCAWEESEGCVRHFAGEECHASTLRDGCM